MKVYLIWYGLYFLLGCDKTNIIPRMLRSHRRRWFSKSGFLDFRHAQKTRFVKSFEADEVCISGHL